MSTLRNPWGIVLPEECWHFLEEYLNFKFGLKFANKRAEFDFYDDRNTFLVNNSKCLFTFFKSAVPNLGSMAGVYGIGAILYDL